MYLVEKPYKMIGVIPPTTQCLRVEMLRITYDDGMDLQMWMNPWLYPNHLYVGRRGRVFIHDKDSKTSEVFHYPDSIWASPFKVGNGNGKYSIDESLRLYRGWIVSKPEMIARLRELDGKVLGCFCRQDGDAVNCHAKVLVELFREYCM